MAATGLLPNGVPVPIVDIDEAGTFKYVLIKIHRAVLNSDGHQDAMFVVRGHTWAEYHGTSNFTSSFTYSNV
jgi:Janus/Ocnus family (Ocnus)